LEISLRAFPGLVPVGSFYGSGRFRPALGLYVHSSKVIYNKKRYLEKHPNRDGFIDIDHTRQKPPGTLRIGVFGDSYVEAMQVDLQATFFRRIPGKLAGQKLEILAFGISGWGTVDSLVTYRHQASLYDLDIIIYPFVKNDPGDNSHTLQSRRRGIVTPTHTASLASNDDGFIIHRPDGPESEPRHRRFARLLKNRSLLARILHSRLQILLLDQAPHSRVLQSRVPQSRVPPASTFSDQEAPPSHWPPALLEESKALTHALLRVWSREVRADGRDFLLLYTPRGPEELSGNLPPEDHWFPWVEEVCADLGIPLIDPRDALRARQQSGEPVYDDHWSPSGHEVISTVLSQYLEQHLLTHR
jgi:hypothetical protein